jgi:hypothetical protein
MVDPLRRVGRLGKHVVFMQGEPVQRFGRNVGCVLLLLFAGTSCACAPLAWLGQGRYDYPEPPPVATAEQRARLAELARTASFEDDDDRRAEMLVELASHMWSMLPERYADDDYDELATFVVETALVSFDERQQRSDAARPEVQVLPKKAPREMVALRITQPKHWTVPAARRMSTSSAAGHALDSAGVFNRNGEGAGRYEHASIFLTEENLQRLEHEDIFDPFVTALYSKNRMAAARMCLISALVDARRMTAADRVAEQRRLSAVLHEIREVETLVLRREDLRYLGASVSGSLTPTGRERAAMEALDEPVRQRLLHLARHPDWAVHLYIRSVMSTVTPEILKAVRAHQNPISLRFFKGLPLPESAGRGADLDVDG